MSSTRLAQLGQAAPRLMVVVSLADAALLIADGDDFHNFCLLCMFIFAPK